MEITAFTPGNAREALEADKEALTAGLEFQHKTAALLQRCCGTEPEIRVPSAIIAQADLERPDLHIWLLEEILRRSKVEFMVYLSQMECFSKLDKGHSPFPSTSQDVQEMAVVEKKNEALEEDGKSLLAERRKKLLDVYEALTESFSEILKAIFGEDDPKFTIGNSVERKGQKLFMIPKAAIERLSAEQKRRLMITTDFLYSTEREGGTTIVVHPSYSILDDDTDPDMLLLS